MMKFRLWLIVAGVAVLAMAVVWYFAGFAIPFTGGNAKLASLEPLSALNGDHCQTFAPDGWSITDANAKGTIFTTASLDHSMVAGYLSVVVSGAVARGANGQPPTPPRAFASQMAMVFTGAPIESTLDGPKFGADEVMTITSGAYGGYILYHAFAIRTDPDGYGLIMRIALGNKEDKKSIGTAGSAAAAVHCQVVSIPQAVDIESSHGTGTTSRCRNGICDDTDLAGTFNAKFGTGWVHDSNGANYNVDVVDDFSEDGPDGPGYYGLVNGTQEKLQPGLQ